MLLIAGIGYFAVDQLNVLIETKGRPVINRQALVSSAGMAAGGLVIKVLSRGFKSRKARIGKKYSLFVLE